MRARSAAGAELCVWFELPTSHALETRAMLKTHLRLELAVEEAHRIAAAETFLDYEVRYQPLEALSFEVAL